MSPFAVGGIILGLGRDHQKRDSAALNRVRDVLDGERVDEDLEIQLLYIFLDTSDSGEITLKASGRRGNQITVEIGVPPGWQDEGELLEKGREALRLGVARLRRPPRRSGGRASQPEDDPDKQVVVSLPADRLSLRDLHALEDAATRLLRRLKLGSVTGHEFGEGSFEIFVEARPRNEERIREEILRLYDAATGADGGLS